MKNVGFVYDFDLTLTEEFQQYPILRQYATNLLNEYGIENPEEYWRLCKTTNHDIAWLQQFAKDASIVFPDLTNERMEQECSPQIQLAPGLPEWFERINASSVRKRD